MKVHVSASGSDNLTQKKPVDPGLALYIPALGRVIRINRERISVGASKFRDLDLSAVPGGLYVEAYCGDFEFRGGDWYFIRKSVVPVQLNGMPITKRGDEVRLNRDDSIVLGDGFRLTVRESAAPETPRNDALDGNMEIYFQSISLSNGHIGIRIRYEASRRMLIREDWGIVGGKKLDKPAAERPVPEEVNTLTALYHFANQCGWEHCSLPKQMYDRDVMLWLSSDAQVQYIAAKGEVLYQRWRKSEETGETEHQCFWCRFSHAVETEAEVRTYARRTWAHIPHNRKGELDQDMELSMPADKNRVVYLAEKRCVVWHPSFQEKVQGKEEEVIRIPDHITTKAKLEQYVCSQRRSWLPKMITLEEFLRDMQTEAADELGEDLVLASGIMWKGLKPSRWQTSYRAADRTVVWVSNVAEPRTATSHGLKVPSHVRTKRQLEKFVRDNRPEWMK